MHFSARQVLSELQNARKLPLKFQKTDFSNVCNWGLETARISLEPRTRSLEVDICMLSGSDFRFFWICSVFLHERGSEEISEVGRKKLTRTTALMNTKIQAIVDWGLPKPLGFGQNQSWTQDPIFGGRYLYVPRKRFPFFWVMWCVSMQIKIWESFRGGEA